jgi:hypothetical protein
MEAVCHNPEYHTMGMARLWKLQISLLSRTRDRNVSAQRQIHTDKHTRYNLEQFSAFQPKFKAERLMQALISCILKNRHLSV